MGGAGCSGKHMILRRLSWPFVLLWMRIHMIQNRLATSHRCQPLAEVGQAVSFLSVGKKEKGPREADLSVFPSISRIAALRNWKSGKLWWKSPGINEQTLVRLDTLGGERVVGCVELVEPDGKADTSHFPASQLPGDGAAGVLSRLPTTGRRGSRIVSGFLDCGED